MPPLNSYLSALKESVGDEHYNLALRQLILSSKFLGSKERKELEECVSNKERKNLLDKWFGHFLAPEIKNLIALFAESKNLKILDSVEIKNDAKNIEVTTAQALSPSLENWFRSELEKKCGSLGVIFKTNPEIIGGVKIKIGDKEIDSSIFSKLSRAR